MNLIDYDNILPFECNYLDLDQNLPHFGDFSNAFIVAHLNIHGLPGKYDDLKDILSNLQEIKLLPDVILLCEKFLSEKKTVPGSFLMVMIY